MSIKTIEITMAQWQEAFSAKEINPDADNPKLLEDEFAAEELAQKVGENHVWTLKYADEGDADSKVLVNGLWSVGAVGFYITEEAYSDDEDYVVTQ
ncbi:hypothetical protein [Amphritea sp. HPY]|uniref:hypothetical protein n=1 Tax=Amphritea sp. HPY TaxID=3421652 RepID=UPI003D7C4F30